MVASPQNSPFQPYLAPYCIIFQLQVQAFRVSWVLHNREESGTGLASRNSFFLYHHPTLLGGPAPVLQLTSRRGGRHLLQESFCDPIFWAMHPSSIMASVTLVWHFGLSHQTVNFEDRDYVVPFIIP